MKASNKEPSLVDSQKVAIPIPAFGKAHFPLQEKFWVEGEEYDHREIIAGLAPLMTDERKAKIDQVARMRSYSLLPILDNIHDEGNIAAVVRSADNFGLQEVHVIRSERIKRGKRASLGSEKWLDIRQWRERKECLQDLKGKGYKIVATVLSPKAVPLEEIDVSSPIAMIFGNERDGVDPEFVEVADIHCQIQTVGFSQSLNISVAAAVCMFALRQKRIQFLSQGLPVEERPCNELAFEELSTMEQQILKAHLYMKTVDRYPMVMKSYRRKNPRNI